MTFSQLKLNILILLAFVCFEAFGKDDAVQLLKSSLKNSPEDTSRVHILLRLSQETSDPDEQLYYSGRALRLSEKLDYQEGIALAHLERSETLIDQSDGDEAVASLDTAHKFFKEHRVHRGYASQFLLRGRYFDGKNEFEQAFAHYDSAILYSSEHGHSDINAESHFFYGALANAIGENRESEKHLKAAKVHFDTTGQRERLWYVYNVLGVAYDDLGNYPLALENYMQALDLVQEFDHIQGQVIVYNNIAVLYSQIDNPKESLKYYDEALELTVGRVNDENKWYLLSNKAEIHAELGDTLAALDNFRKALELVKAVEDECEQVYILEGIGLIMAQKNELDSAINCYNEAIDLSNECNNQLLLTIVKRRLGEVMSKLRKYNQSRLLLLESLQLSEEFKFSKEREKAYYQLYLLSKKLNQTQTALTYFERYSALKDSLFGIDSNMAMARIGAEFEFKKELKRLEYSREAEELKLQADLEREESNKNVLLLVLILTVLLAATLIRSYFLLQGHTHRLEALNQEKNTLLGVVAHDLRSPLNNIKGLLSLMKGDASFDKVSGEGKEYFKLLSNSTNHMREMIDKALDINAIEEMKLNLDLQKHDLAVILKGVSDSFNFMASKKHIEIMNGIDTNSYFAQVDINYAVQIFDNLVSNAIKFSEPHKKVYLDVRKENGHIVASVKDEGPGMSQSDQAKLFTKYQKLSAKPTGDEQSIGLGLSIVKKFVDAMGGSINCISELGEGSCFEVRFPAAK